MNNKEKYMQAFIDEGRELLGVFANGLQSLEKTPDDSEILNNIFRSAHTIKGSSSILEIEPISILSHSMEDVLDELRGKKITYTKELTDLLMRAGDTLSDMIEQLALHQDIKTDIKNICNELQTAASGGYDTGSKETTKNIIAIDPEILAVFAEDAKEIFASLEKDLIILEKSPTDEGIINNIFRGMHSIKGGASFLNMDHFTKVAHSLENLMNKVRDGSIQVTGEMIDILYEGLDNLKALSEETAGISLKKCNISDILSKIELLKKASKKKSNSKKTKKPLKDKKNKNKEKVGTSIKKQEPPKLTTALTSPGNEKKSFTKAQPLVKPIITETIRVSTKKLDDTIKLLGEMVSSQSSLKQRLFDMKEIERLSMKSRNLIENFSESKKLTKNLRNEIKKTTEALHIKLKQLLSNTKDYSTLQELLTFDLQDKAMKMRMLPISTVFDTFNRAVRDISRSIGKRIDLTIEGGETELDRKMIEKIGDPLVHMIRNSIDHGIEIPSERLKAGKNEEGKIKISACYEGGNVLIKISDDGAGLPIEKIKYKALEKKIISEERLDNMTKSEIVDLIFHPGFSTNESITSISGRGVGMDVVKRNIVEELKGTIHIDTEEGKGSIFYIRLPLSLSIMRMLIVSTSDLTYAIPMSYVREIIRVPLTEIIEVVDERAVRLHEQIIPIVDLYFILNLPKIKINNDKKALIIIVHVGNERLGLIVDYLLDEVDMVIKPLPSLLSDIKWVSGVIISGRNELVNVLHIPTIINSAKDIKENFNKEEKSIEKQRIINLLVVDDSKNTREVEQGILESYGYSVNTAENGYDALDKVKNNNYDLIITDIDMPKMDGITLTTKLKKDNIYKNIPIIIVSSKNKEEIRMQGLKVGANAYITKGDFNQTVLWETIKNLVG